MVEARLRQRRRVEEERRCARCPMRAERAAHRGAARGLVLAVVVDDRRDRALLCRRRRRRREQRRARGEARGEHRGAWACVTGRIPRSLSHRRAEAANFPGRSGRRLPPPVCGLIGRTRSEIHRRKFTLDAVVPPVARPAPARRSGTTRRAERVTGRCRARLSRHVKGRKKVIHFSHFVFRGQFGDETPGAGRCYLQDVVSEQPRRRFHRGTVPCVSGTYRSSEQLSSACVRRRPRERPIGSFSLRRQVARWSAASTKQDLGMRRTPEHRSIRWRSLPPRGAMRRGAPRPLASRGPHAPGLGPRRDSPSSAGLWATCGKLRLESSTPNFSSDFGAL